MTRGMTSDDLFRIQWLSDARVSPDGRRVAFTVTRMDAEADDYRSSVWLVATDGGEPRRLTTGPGKDSAPRWSPDGARLAFLSDRDGGKPQLHVIDADGGEARRLTDPPSGVGAAVWSPDGTRLVAVVRTGGEDDSTHDAAPEAPEAEPERPDGDAPGPGSATTGSSTRRGAASDKKPKTPPARLITTLKYRANGEGFTYDRRRHLLVIDVASGDTRPLTDGDWDDIQPAWSPDGRRIAFVSARHDERDHDRSRDIFVVDAGGGEPVCITPGGGAVSLPAWSPDGAMVAYLGYADAEDAPRNSRLWVVAAGDAALAAGGAGARGAGDRAAPIEPAGATGSRPIHPRCLTERLDRDLEISDSAAPLWPADGQTITVGMLDRGAAGVVRVRVADSAVTPLVEGPRTVASFDMSADGSVLVFVASDPCRPGEVFVRDAAGERALTDLNAAWRAEVVLPEAERFTVVSDGVEIDCWLIRPAGFEPGRRYPALLNVHGGPFAQYGWSFHDEFAVQAGAGYVVVCCNPRGSSGREDEFSRAIAGRPGEPDAADVLAAMDEALHRHDFIDPARTGLLGGSYGGYLTAWIAGHTDRFAAACPERGLYNRYSKEGTSDIWSGYTYLRVRQWEDPELYWRYSPITYVRDMRTPLLIIHSEEDIRCPIEQAEQLYVALKQMRREVRFVRFPGENHELSRGGKPSHRVQRFGYILDWFDEKLAASAHTPAEAAAGS